MDQPEADTFAAATGADALPARDGATGKSVRRERILAELQGIVTRMSGKDVPLSAETRIDKHLKTLGQWEETIDLLDLGFRIESTFGIRFNLQGWIEFGGLDGPTSNEILENVHGKDFTFGNLADFIAARISRAWTDDDKEDPLAPLVILGKPCQVAGAYRTLERIAHNEIGSHKHFGPSTPIQSILRGSRLQRFWAHSRRLSDYRVPPLGKPTKTVADYLFNVVIGIIVVAVMITLIGAGISVFLRDDGVMWTFFGSVAFLLVPLALVCLFLMIPGSLVSYLLKRGNYELPYGIKTFADLSRHVSGEHGGFCVKCSYNLTGNTSGVCPECGEPIPNRT